MLRLPEAAAVHVRVPATSANLGPGFDCAGLALNLHDDVLVEVAGRSLTIDVVGEGSTTLPRDERHLVASSLRWAFDQLDVRQVGLKITCINRIPQGRGLGSSAAAIVAAVTASLSLTGRPDAAAGLEALRLAAAREGHPDNVAACLLGGLTLAWTESGGPRAITVQAAVGLAPVIFVPGNSSWTKEARALLPVHVPHADAVANSSRAALLAHAVAQDPALLLAATEDWLHERYRADSRPATTALIERLRADGLPAVTSGAGPSVIVLAVGEQRRHLLARPEPGWRVLGLDVQRTGTKVVSLSLP